MLVLCVGCHSSKPAPTAPPSPTSAVAPPVTSPPPAEAPSAGAPPPEAQPKEHDENFGQRRSPELAVRDSCKVPGNEEAKYRWNVKHRAESRTRPTSVTVDDMLQWPDPDHISDENVRKKDDPKDLLDSHESEVRELEGDVWVLKIEDNDCDWHMELSAPGAGAKAARVIVEVPQGDGFEQVRTSVASLVAVRDIKDQCFKFTKPARVRITVIGFFDGHHWSEKHPHVGWRHGSDFVKTLWELHPVWDVTVEQKGTAGGCE